MESKAEQESENVKRTFKCTGCGNDRPCVLTTEQEKEVILDDYYDPSSDLKCVLDSTNRTSYNWQEVLTILKDK